MSSTSSTFIHHLPHWLPICRDTLADMAALPDQFDQHWRAARYMPWRFCYMDYEMLQREMTTAQENGIMSTSSSRLQEEWIKIYDFCMLKKGEIDRRILSFQDQRRSNSTLSSTFSSLTLEILQLYRFAKLNYCGFLRLFMQYDSSNDTDLRKVVLHKPFWTDAMEYHKLAIEANYLYLASALVSPYYRITTFFNTQQQQQQDGTKAETDNSKGSHVPLPQQQQQANTNNHASKRAHHGRPLAYSPLPCSIHSCETTPSSASSDTSLHSPPAQQQQRHSTYWLHPNNMLEIMLYLSDKTMIVQDDSLLETPAVNEIGYSDRHHTRDQQYKMTTLYMDTPQLSGYTQRLSKSQATTMTRVRWYNSISSLETLLSPHAMVEQKVYDATTTSKEWVQQRVWLKSKHVQPWLSGSFSLGSILSKDACQYHADGNTVGSDDVIHEMKDACLLMEHPVHTGQIQPVLKVTQNRIVYTSMDHAITISIDSDISMYATQDATTGVDPFPYCVVGITTTSTDHAENQWFMKLMKCGMLTPVDGFSAYLHGVGTLYKNVPAPNRTSICMNDTGHEPLLMHRRTPPQHGGKQGIITTKNSLDSIQTSGSSSSNRSSSSTSTIATIITCYDDDNLDEKPQQQPSSVTASPIDASTTTNSPLLHPHDSYFRQQGGTGGMRRSFDSYCSFDHPTSSRSDPTNCKNCLDRILFSTEQQPFMTGKSYGSIRSSNSSSRSISSRSSSLGSHLPIVSVYEKETITFSSFLLQTFWPRKFRSFEKEPLLVQHHHHHHRKHRRLFTSSKSNGSIASCHSNHSTPLPSATPASPAERFSRAAILTMTCVVMSLSMSCILYITVLTKL
ncbi:VTC domain-containing protein [Mucor lusitanicus]